MENNLKLSDLNDFCLLQIFDKLSFFELLNVSSINERLHDIGFIVFLRKYPEYETVYDEFINLIQSILPK